MRLFDFFFNAALYYNKIARKSSLEKVVGKVQQSRPDTTEHDVYRKFQTLRTQYGQEWAKVRKSHSAHEGFVYQPKIWWWRPLAFLRPFMKPRSSVSYVAVKDDSSSLKDDYEEEDESEIIQEIHLEMPEHSDPPHKKIRLGSSQGEVITDEVTKENYVIIEEQLSTAGDERQQREIIVEPYQSTAQPYQSQTDSSEPKRHEEIGKFVAAQMATIKDDILFYRTQMDILTLINKAQIKQLERNSQMINIIETTDE